MTAIEAPGGRYRYESDFGVGTSIQVSDGRFVWYYRPTQSAYTQQPAGGKKPDLPKILSVDDLAIKGAAELADGMTWYAGRYKSAKRLSDGRLTLNGREFDCYIIELTNGDLKIPQVYPFTETLWIEKESFKFRKIVGRYITTLNQRGSAPITYPSTRVSLYPEVSLNEPIPDAAFQFVPPAAARLVEEFQDRPHRMPETRPAVRMARDVVLKSVDGSLAKLESFRGHPVLIDLWATWCGPCVEAFPELARIYERTHPAGLVILSVDQNDDAKVAQAYLEKMRYPWPNYHDQGEVGEAFGNEAVPRVIMIDAKGEIVFDRVSPTKQDLLAAIAKLGPSYAAAVADK